MIHTLGHLPRAGEVYVAYTFLSDDDFDRMVAKKEFVEWASVGGQRYGTSVAGAQAVAASGKAYLMDLDAGRGGARRARRPRPFCVWVAPPSLDELRARRRSRGTQDGAEIERRIMRATEEIESRSRPTFSTRSSSTTASRGVRVPQQALEKEIG